MLIYRNSDLGSAQKGLNSVGKNMLLNYEPFQIG